MSNSVITTSMDRLFSRAGKGSKYGHSEGIGYDGVVVQVGLGSWGGSGKRGWAIGD